MKDNKLSSKDWELISAYLDNELNAQEKARMEERIKIHPEYKEAIDGLRRTKTILARAPVRKVPRNFTLTLADVQSVRSPRWIPVMQWSSAVVAMIAVFLFAYQLLPGLPGTQRTSTDLAAVSPTESPMEMAAPETMAAAEATPEIIYWGGAPLPSGGYGMGGGDSGCGAPNAMCGGGAADGIGGGGGGAPVTEMPFPQPPIPNPLPDLQPTSAAKVAAVPAEPVTGTGPVLGVRSEEEQGEVLPETGLYAPDVSTASREAESAPARTWMLAAAAGLLALAVGLFIAGVVIRRKALR